VSKQADIMRDERQVFSHRGSWFRGLYQQGSYSPQVKRLIEPKDGQYRADVFALF
jgi:hypothetical protein